MKKAIGAAMILLLMLSAGVTSGLANTKEQFCATYADRAVAQYNQGKQHNLPGIVPPAWSNDRNGHYNWCMMAPENIVNSEYAKRQAYLDKNITKDNQGKGSVSEAATANLAAFLPKMAIVTGIVTGDSDSSYLGCFKDRKDRDISGFSFNAPNMTKDLCLAKCRQKGFSYAGLQYSRYCFCGNSYGKLGKANNCNMPCAGNKAQTCGGGWANSVYRVTSGNNNGNFAKMAPMPTAGTGQVNVLKNLANKLQVRGPIDLGVAQQFLSTRADPKTKDKKLLSPYEHPMFDLEVGDSVSQAVVIGRGYNSLLGQVRFTTALEEILPTDIRTLWAFNSHAGGHYVRTSEDYYDALGIAVDVSGSYMGFSASSSTRYEESNANSRFTETYAAYTDIDTFLKYPTLTDLKLNNNARTLLKQKGVAEFYRQYGDSFVYAIQYGAGFKGTRSYDYLKEEEQYKFSQAVSGGGWGVKAKVGYERSSKEKMEHVEGHGAFHSYGAAVPEQPQSVKELKDVFKKFQQIAYSFANRSNDNNAHGGVVRYTLIKYSNLPEFMQLAGGVDKLNLTEAKMLLSQLTYYKRKIKRMKNNLLFVIDSENNRSKFSDQDRSRAAQLLQQKIDPQLILIKNDIGRLQRDPFNRNLLTTIAGNVQTYKKVSGFVPSSEFVKVTVDFPHSPRDKSHQDIWDAQVGPLIGWPHVGGDDQVASSGKIDVNINSELEISPDKNNIYLYQKFHLRENKPDYTTISGSKRLKVYTAPKGYRIVGLKQKRADYYHMRNMRGDGYIPEKDVLSRDNGAPPAKADDLWEELHVIFDNAGAQDSKYVGLYGKMRMFVELEELAPKE